MLFACALGGRSGDGEVVAEVAKLLHDHLRQSHTGQVKFYGQLTWSVVVHRLKGVLMEEESLGVFGRMGGDLGRFFGLGEKCRMVRSLTQSQAGQGENQHKKKYVAHGELVCTKCSLFDIRRAHPLFHVPFLCAQDGVVVHVYPEQIEVARVPIVALEPSAAEHLRGVHPNHTFRHNEPAHGGWFGQPIRGTDHAKMRLQIVRLGGGAPGHRVGAQHGREGGREHFGFEPAWQEAVSVSHPCAQATDVGGLMAQGELIELLLVHVHAREVRGNQTVGQRRAIYIFLQSPCREDP